MTMFNKSLFLAFCGLIIAQAAFAQSVKNGLRLSVDKHGLVDARTGRPVFILATTAWNINALTYPEIDTLLQTTAAHGFNSIMFALDFYPQADEANIYGQKAYIGPERTDLNPEYFNYCDHIVQKCTELGLYPMIYTMWSGKTTGVMNTYTPQQLHLMGLKLGTRFKNYKNVILVAGGESAPPYIDTARVNAMGNGLKQGSAGSNLISVHPTSPHSNSEFYAHCPWLDFYMIQGKSNLAGLSFDFTKLLAKDYENAERRPVMLAEQRYESGILEDPLIQRRSLYLSVFAGGFGYAYGHNALWQMTPHTGQPWMMKSWKPGVKNWKEALNTPAQNQLHYIIKLLAAFPGRERFPDQSLVTNSQGDSISNKVQVLRDGHSGQNDAACIMAYAASPKFITIHTAVIRSAMLRAYRFDPKTGLSEVVGKPFRNIGSYTATPYPEAQDQVWILAAAKYSMSLSFQH